MRNILAILLTGCLSLTLQAQTKHAITHEKMWAMKRIGAPEISADGKWVVFSVLNAAYDDKDQNSDLWIVSANGGAPRKITNTKSPETNYTWSPDNKTVAFAAKREDDEASQIYSINIIDGGEAQRITNLSTSPGSPKFSPDGSMILFTSSVYPGAFTDSANKKISDDLKKVKYKARVYNSYPIRFWDQWLDEKQTHLFVQKIQAGAEVLDLFAGTGLAGSEGFFTNGTACWSADSKSVLFTAQTNRGESIYKDVVSDIYKVAVTGGKETKLTNDGHSYGDLSMSNDGNTLYAQSSDQNNYKIYNLGKLVRFDYPSMQRRTVLANQLDKPINRYQLTPNGILLSAESEGTDRLFIIPGSETEANPLINNIVGCYTNIRVAGDNTIVANYESSSLPAEVVKVNSVGHNFLTQFNKDKLATLDMPAIESFWMTSSRGKRIRSYIVRPAGFDPGKKYPLFVVIHGGPAGAWKDNFGYRWNYHLLAAPGYVLILTDYTGSTGYGEKFSQDIQYDPFKGPATEINEAAAYAIKQYPFIDGNMQAAGGASYGGHLASWMQATTTHYKCLVCHAGLINSESQWGTSDGIYDREVMNGGAPWTKTKTWKEQNPIQMTQKFKTPILITVGEKDFRVPMNNSIENFYTAQRMKIPSKLIVFPDENHWILNAENSRYFYKEVNNWLKKYLH